MGQLVFCIVLLASAQAEVQPPSAIQVAWEQIGLGRQQSRVEDLQNIQSRLKDRLTTSPLLSAVTGQWTVQFSITAYTVDKQRTETCISFYVVNPDGKKSFLAHDTYRPGDDELIRGVAAKAAEQITKLNAERLAARR